MDKGFEQIFLQRTYTNGQSAQEKMFNIISCQGNANQNHNEIPLHTHYGVQLLKKKKENNKCQRGCGKIGAVANETLKWYSHSGKQFSSPSEA